MHVDPTVSNPKRIHQIPDDVISNGEARPTWDQSDLETPGEWHGLWKDVGIFSDVQWDIIMAKCLTSMGQPSSLASGVPTDTESTDPEIPLADSGSLTTGSSVDSQAGFEIGRLPKPTWRICTSFYFSPCPLSCLLQFPWPGSLFIR